MSISYRCSACASPQYGLGGHLLCKQENGYLYFRVRHGGITHTGQLALLDLLRAETGLWLPMVVELLNYLGNDNLTASGTIPYHKSNN